MGLRQGQLGAQQVSPSPLNYLSNDVVLGMLQAHSFSSTWLVLRAARARTAVAVTLLLTSIHEPQVRSFACCSEKAHYSMY